MTHEAFQDERLSAWLDGTLSARDRATLDAELGANPALQRELDALRHAQEAVRALPPVHAPASLLANVLAELEHEPVSISLWQRLRRPFNLPLEGIALAAAAAAVLYFALPARQAPAPAAQAVATKEAAQEPDQSVVAVLYSYSVQVAEPRSLGELQRVAKALGGEVRDSQKNRIDANISQPDGGQFYVAVPATRLSELPSKLATLGRVSSAEDGRVSIGALAEVSVTLRVQGSLTTPAINLGDVYGTAGEQLGGQTPAPLSAPVADPAPTGEPAPPADPATKPPAGPAPFSKQPQPLDAKLKQPVVEPR